ncbi:ribosomal RNA-processing protein 8 [Sardina pilchardus]|uniref:ribosomal RNA-processing protein 8 n=1 Tax=Sardina pilchardus TaxID=27697 RepID=UPI002E14ADBB
MFAEEEWNDTASAGSLTQCANTDKDSIKEKVTVTAKAGKMKSLLRTLQTLGSARPAPDWSSCSAPKDSDSEAEKEAPTSQPKKKKKRIKKRKRGLLAKSQTEGGDGANPAGDDIPEVAKKQKLSPQVKASKKNSIKSVTVEQMEGAQMDKETSSSIEKALSRKQWKNRMKNKRKCKNKYQDKNHPLQVSTSETGQGRTGPVKGSDKEDTSSEPKQIEPCETNQAKSKMSRKAEIKRKKQAAKKSSSSIPPSNTDEVVPIESLTVTSNITNDDLNENLVEPPEKAEPLKPSDKRKQKERQMRADKLRHILDSHRSDAKAKSAEDGEESTQKETDEEDKVKGEGQPLDRSAALRSKMEKRLEAARFRYINEVLYTTSSSEAKRMFKQDPKAFEVYHLGFTTQVQHWPENPVDAIISFIHQKPASLVVADFGCGDCKIARSVKNKVHSFDLAPTCDLVTVCDMANVPLEDSSVHIAVFCLSLMGTNLSDFLAEANRVLFMSGVLKIAEVASRFENVRGFVGALSSLGFKLTSKDTNNNYFYLFEFVKVAHTPENTKKAGLALRPCVYKKR